MFLVLRQGYIRHHPVSCWEFFFCLFHAFYELLRQAQVIEVKGGKRGQMGEGLEKLLPAQLQQAGHSQPDLEQRARSLVLVDVHHTPVNVHAASLKRTTKAVFYGST